MVRTYFTLFTLCFISFMSFGQTLQLEKASPFTAVKWENEQPMVQFENEWFTLEKLDDFSTKEIVDFCKQEYGSGWQKRFSEDLVEVLKEMGAPPNKEVKLLLTDGSQKKNALGTYTFENRQKIWAYNQASKKSLKNISVAQALEDVSEFQQSLEEHSSYVHLTDYDYKSALDSLQTTLSKSTKPIDINELTHELAKIMAEIGDRHSRVRNEAFVKEEDSTYSLQLPFSIAPLNGKAVALQRLEKEGVYEYLYPEFPFIKSIQEMTVPNMIDSLVYKSKKAPAAAKWSRGLTKIQQLGRLYFINNLKLPEQIEIVFTNGKTDKTEVVPLQSESFRYYSKLERDTHLKSKAIKKGHFGDIAKVLKGNIGYLSLPEMYHFEEIGGLEKFMDSTRAAFDSTKALIIDVRFNPGGRRDFIQKMASYIIPESESPWVANVAYLRIKEKGMIHNCMSSRYLYSYTSDQFDAVDRKSIDVFSENFKTQREFDTSRFSDPHYMLLRGGNNLYTKPIYILINEHSFSAASVFTSAFKGLPNVKIVGVTTDGSSGNSKRMHLKHSNIRVKVSTMLSFQRNGKTLDANGTQPDFYIPETEAQILKGKDVQLERLMEMIK